MQNQMRNSFAPQMPSAAIGGSQPLFGLPTMGNSGTAAAPAALPLNSPSSKETQIPVTSSVGDTRHLPLTHLRYNQPVVLNIGPLPSSLHRSRFRTLMHRQGLRMRQRSLASFSSSPNRRPLRLAPMNDLCSAFSRQSSRRRRSKWPPSHCPRPPRRLLFLTDWLQACLLKGISLPTDSLILAPFALCLVLKPLPPLQTASGLGSPSALRVDPSSQHILCWPKQKFASLTSLCLPPKKLPVPHMEPSLSRMQTS